MLYDTSGKPLQHQQHSIGGGSSKRSGGLIKQLSSAASGSQSPQQQNRLRMLLKRSSEPLLIFQHNHQQQYQSRVCVCSLINDINYYLGMPSIFNINQVGNLNYFKITTTIGNALIDSKHCNLLV